MVHGGGVEVRTFTFDGLGCPHEPAEKAMAPLGPHGIPMIQLH